MSTPAEHPSKLVLVGKIFAPSHLALQGGTAMENVLRVVWSPEQEPPPAPPSPAQPIDRSDLARTLTLRDCYERYLRREHEQSRSRDCLTDTLRALTLFEEWWTACQNGEENHRRMHLNHRSIYPVVTFFDGDQGDEVLADWQTWLVREDRWSLATIRKYARAITTLLNRIGPRTTANKGGKGLLSHVPAFPSLAEAEASEDDGAPPRVIEHWELDATYRACDVATWPAGDVPAPLVWRTALVAWIVTGLRTQDVMAYQSGPTLEWRNIEFGRRCPYYPRLENQWGWIWSVPRKTRRYRKRLVLPMHQVLHAHLMAIRTPGCREDTPILSCPHVSGSNGRQSGFYSQWRAIQEEARKSNGTGYESFLPHNLRKTASNAWDFAADGLGEKVLLHAERGVNAQFYRNTLPRFVEALARLPLPATFVAAAHRLTTGQKTLF